MTESEREKKLEELPARCAHPLRNDFRGGRH